MCYTVGPCCLSILDPRAHGLQELWHLGLVAPYRIHVPRMGKWILNHWTTKEAPPLEIFKEDWAFLFVP